MLFVCCRVCSAPASADKPFLLGRDDRGVQVWGLKWRCVRAHWYMEPLS